MSSQIRTYGIVDELLLVLDELDESEGLQELGLRKILLAVRGNLPDLQSEGTAEGIPW